MDNEMFPERTNLDHLRDAVDRIKAAIGSVIVGQHEMVDLLIAAILSDGHVLIEGVPGIAKTLTAKLLAKTVDVKFSRIQFTPDLMPTDVLGTMIFNPKSAEFSFRQGPVFGNLILIDEINRAPAKTQSALFEVMEERQITMDGTTYAMDVPFMVLATQNPIEQEGTYRLPEAQLDRFLFKIEVKYPTLEEEISILQNQHHTRLNRQVDELSPVISAGEISSLRAQVAQLHIEEKIIAYIAALIHETRQHPSLSLGASPRASIAVMQSSKALAAMQGRDFVTPDDVTRLLPAVLRHRILLTPDKEMEGVTPDAVVAQIIKKIEVPR
ncbi:MAG: MoxR family ATPase [Mucilaginibacter polytrichastri]|nr:MoxR family ATPase [Mucilaginibacter polytrichastri]